MYQRYPIFSKSILVAVCMAAANLLSYPVGNLSVPTLLHPVFLSSCFYMFNELTN